MSDFYFAPDDPPVGGGTTTVAAPAIPAPSTIVSAPAAPAQPPVTITAGAPEVPSTPSWLDGLKSKGVTFAEADESKIIDNLAQSWKDAQQLKPLSPHVAAYQQHAVKFHEWLNQQNQPPKKEEEQDWTEKLGWKPPQWDRGWEALVRQDEQGNLVPAPGAPPEIVAKYQAYAQFRKQQVDRLLENPYKFMEPAIRHIAEQIAQEKIQTNLGSYQDQLSAKNFVETNRPWLYEMDNGKPKTEQVWNPMSGRYDHREVLSQWGEIFRGKVVERQKWYEQRGLAPDHADLTEYALREVQLAYAVSQLPPEANGAAREPATTAREAANAGFLGKNNPPVKKGGSAAPAKEKITNANLEQHLAEALKASGGVI